MGRKKASLLISVALSTAILAVAAQLAIPLPTGIPLTLQSFALAFAGYYLGASYGTLSVAVYIALGAMGAPVFTNLSGGFHKFLSLTGGFIWGFLLLALMCGLGNTKAWSKREALFALICGICGVILCHLCGIIQFSALSQSDPLTAVLISSLPYLPKDILSVIAAYFTAKTVKKRLRRSDI